MSSQSGNVILGTLLGAAVGFAAGILLAPAKGTDTREMLLEKGEDWKKSLEDATDRTVSSLKDLRETAERKFRKGSEDLTATAKSKANEAAKAVKNA